MTDPAFSIVIALSTIAILIAMSIAANQRFRSIESLPMQWSIGGQVNWFAPRRFALSATPVLGAILFILTILSIAFFDARPGQEAFERRVPLILSFALVAVHAIHLWLINRWRRSRSR